MSQAGKKDLIIEQHASFEKLLFFQRLSIPLNLAGESFLGQIKLRPSETKVYADFGFEIFDQSQLSSRGRIRMFLTFEQTGQLIVPKGVRFQEYYYDVVRVRANGSRQRVLQGHALVYPGVSV